MAEASPREPASTDVRVGTLVGVFGLHGELKLAATRLGADALRAGLSATLRFPDGREHRARIAGVRRHKGRPLVRLAEVADADAAAALVGAEVTIARADAALGADEYLDADLIGCRVVDLAGEVLGEVVDVGHYPAQDMLFVGPARAMLPLVRAFVREIDVAAKRIAVDVPPGLLSGEADEA